MFSKGLVCGTHYIRFVIPSIIKRNCLNPSIPKFGFSIQENKISFSKSNFCSSYEGSRKLESPEYPENEIDNEGKIMLQKWINMLKYEGERVPKEISEEQLFELLSLSSITGRRKLLNFFYIKECKKLKDKTRKENVKELKRQKLEERINSRPEGHIEYGLWKNTMFAKNNDAHFKTLLNHKLINAMIFNQPLVIDMGFFDHMERREISSLSEQISNSFSCNRLSSDPFNLTLCNIDFESQKFQSIQKQMPNILSPSFPMNITSKSYLDIFPKEKLVYLTPNARDEMTEFDHEAIYIIGGLVDLRTSRPVTVAKAKKENIKMMKLPIDRYHISRGKNDLAINIMVKILLDLQENGNWKKALKNIPKRLLYTSDDSHLIPHNKPSRFK
ncbi:Mitochondrial ribonuclease P protein 1-like protein [Armadillidium vulgare]|nr:Mitochondrial ribonuclease P protein 1-like protein [Armadillidium vulgare]